jgi:hypothetical protein
MLINTQRRLYNNWLARQALECIGPISSDAILEFFLGGWDNGWCSHESHTTT